MSTPWISCQSWSCKWRQAGSLRAELGPATAQHGHAWRSCLRFTCFGFVSNSLRMGFLTSSPCNRFFRHKNYSYCRNWHGLLNVFKKRSVILLFFSLSQQLCTMFSYRQFFSTYYALSRGSISLKGHLVSPTPLQWAGTSSSRSGCSEPRPNWPWMFPGMGHLLPLWATSVPSVSPPSS